MIWRRLTPTSAVGRFVGATAVAMLATVLVAMTSGAAQAAPPTIGFQVQGNQLFLNSSPFLPRGFNMIGVLSPPGCVNKLGNAAAAHFGQPEMTAAKNWGANTLRFQVSQSGLVTANTTNLTTYLAQISSAVSLAHQNGFAVILSMQDQSIGCGPVHPLPNDDTVAAWRNLAPLFATDPYAMFELFNEPHNDTTAAGWAQWQNGGTTPLSNLNTPAVGFQALVNDVRGDGADNVLLVDGAKNAELFQGMPFLQDADGGNGVAYAVHPYSYVGGGGVTGPAYFSSRFGFLAASAPMIATEWNYPSSACGTASRSAAPALLSYLQSNNIGLLAHALDVPGSTIADWTWSPTQCGTSSGGSGADTRSDFAAQAASDTSRLPPVPTVTAAGPNEVDVSWSTPSNAVGLSGYNLYREGTLLATQSDTTNYVDTSVSPNTYYRYTVQAVDGTNTPTAQSAVASVTTPPLGPGSDTTPPSVPDNATADLIDPASAVISWQAATDDTGVTGYDVYRDGGLLAAVTDGTTYSDGGLASATTYSYSVVAYDSSGNASAPSASASVTTPDTQAPSAVTAPTVGLTDATTAAVNWQPATDDVGVAGYNVYRNGTQIAQVSGTSFGDGGLTAATSYAYSVAAYDAAGNVGPASPVTTIATPDTVAPSAPADLHASATGSAVTLTWPAASDNVGVTGYVVYRNGSRVAGVAGLSYTDRTVKQGTTYSYSTAAYDAAGNTSPKSVARSATVPDTIAPTAPKSLKAVPGVKSIALSWTAASDNVRVAGYRLYQGTKLIATTSNTSFTATSLTKGSKYKFHVVAYDAAGNVSTASSTVSAISK